MGAHSFQVVSKQTDPAAAYRDLVAAALVEHGRDTYNGTISTTSGFHVFGSTPLTPSAAQRIANERLSVLDKWGHCEAVAVGSVTRVRTIKRTVDAVSTDPTTTCAQLDTALVAEKTLIPVPLIAGFRVLASAPKYRYRTVKAGPARRVWTTSNGGEYASRADATAAAKKQLVGNTANPASGSVSIVKGFDRIEVFQRTVRTPEAAIERILLSWKVRLEIDVVEDAATIPFDHWLFYGWAAS